MRPLPLLALVLALCLAVPAAARAQANDACADATVIKSLPFTRTFAVDGATFSAGDPDPSCTGDRPNVWFAYTARADVSLELDATASNFPAALVVFRGDCAAPVELACSEYDYSSQIGSGHVVLALAKGETLRIAIITPEPPTGAVVTLTARKSVPRYRTPERLTELLRSSDPSPYGGSQGWLLAAAAQTDKRTAFVQQSEVVLADVGGVLTTVAHSGAPSPIGGTFATFQSPVVSATDVYFLAQLDGGPVAEGIFKWNGTTVTAHLVPGDAGPGDTTLRSFGSRLAVSATGRLAFLARTVGDGDDKLLWYDGATVTQLADEKDASPCGGKAFRSFGASLAIDDGGTKVAFVASVEDVGDGVFTADAEDVTAIACEGDPTPGGGTYTRFGDRPAINDLGEVYFTGNAGADDAVLVATGGDTAVVATRFMVLASGESIRRIAPNQELATNAAGDVVFTASLVDQGTAIVASPHLAPLPAAIVKRSHACPLGGTFAALDDELDLSAAGEVAFDAECDGGHGSFRKPVAGASSTVASVASPTAIGSGFTTTARIDAAGTRLAARGFRATLQTLTCAKTGCTPTGLVDPTTPIANRPGQVAGTLFPTTFAGNDKTLAIVATTTGGTRRDAVLRIQKGVLDVVAAVGDALPGGVGTFADFLVGSSLTAGDDTVELAVGAEVVAFRAAITDHPTADEGVFAATAKGLVPIALVGDPAPRGGLFADIARPTAAGRSIVFLASTTESGNCLFAARAPGKPVDAVACPDDPISGTAGTIGDFLTVPTGEADDLYVLADVQGAPSCLLRFRNGKTSALLCQDDLFPGGTFFDTLSVSDLGLRTDAKAKGPLFVARPYDADGSGTLMLLRRDTVTMVLTPEITPAPLSGGTIAALASFAAGPTTIVAATTITGGTATSALFQATLP